MTNGSALWEALKQHSPKRQWIPLAQVFAIVETHIALDAEDLANTSVTSGKPRWKSNVRRLLRVKQQAGTIRSRKHPRPDRKSR